MTSARLDRKTVTDDIECCDASYSMVSVDMVLVDEVLRKWIKFEHDVYCCWPRDFGA